ncbi:hypothetical protein VNO77_21407 [Canavalia gladiata]|uniref:Uncharacterized protein n=1 Tax=Canavalia gladiata TaxID=3824 RepID=A0AAN9QM96_CANGL
MYSKYRSFINHHCKFILIQVVSIFILFSVAKTSKIERKCILDGNVVMVSTICLVIEGPPTFFPSKF